MKPFSIYSLVFLCMTIVIGANADAGAGEGGGTAEKWRIRIDTPREDRLAGGTEGSSEWRSAAQGTTWLATYSFQQGNDCIAEGWVSVDRTEQAGDYFHVDDFAGLGGGDFGGLYPLEGSQSMWCGVRPDAGDPVLCGYGTAPGYGDNWDQAFCSAGCLSVTGGARIDFSAAWDAEPGYDAAVLEIDNCDDDWVEIFGGVGVWDGSGSDTYSVTVADSLHEGSLRFRFRFVSNHSYSDQDGQHNTDGAFILDAVSVTDSAGTVVAYEDFEDETVGDTDADDWVSCTPPGYGHFAGLFNGYGVFQEDRCEFNASCLWGFYEGSAYDYACGGSPIQAVVPYGNARGQYLHNEIWSPYIPVAGSGNGWELRFDVYRDLTLNALVLYNWGVRSIVAGCAGAWRYNIHYYSGGGKDWVTSTKSIAHLIEPGATDIQVTLLCRDMCGVWGGFYGDCTCHSHSPLFDNVQVYRVDTTGPQWSVDDADLFQDTFAEDGTITGTARADMAADILPDGNPNVLPGDSAVVMVDDPADGLGYHTPGDPASGPAVYCFVTVYPPGQANKTGDHLVDDLRYHVVGTQSINGDTWTQIQMDSCWTAEGDVVADRFNVDLNDHLFVPGDTVSFFFGSQSGPPSSAWTYFSFPVRTPSGQTNDVVRAAIGADEFTVLPAAGYLRGGTILYVDGMNFRGREMLPRYGVNYEGAQVYFDTAFQMLGVWDEVDRYDIRAPSSAVGNHPGVRVRNIAQQITQVYRQILWDCGDLGTAFSDGESGRDKSDDAQLLYQFMDNLPLVGGVYLCGDDVASEWDTFSGMGAVNLRSVYMNFTVVSGDHTGWYGISPRVIGDVPNTIFKDVFDQPDTLFAYGGCRDINDFDVLEAYGSSNCEAIYLDQFYGPLGAGAILSQVTTNGQGNDVGFMLSGFSFDYIRDDRPYGWVARAELLYKTLSWLGKLLDMPIGVASPGHLYSLSQNVPNPFNPTTTIRYSIAQRGHVSLKIYNVAGQLVKTLVDETQSPETVKPVTWDGRNNAGLPVSSGVYFYKLTAKGFTKTKKMIILK